MSNVRIREPSDGDFATIASITNHYVMTTAIHFAHEPVAAAALRDGWVHDRARFPWRVAELDGDVVGYAKAGTWRERAAYRWTAEVGLYVAPDRQRAGIGGALYRELLAELARRGFRSAVAGITLPNAPSVALHERLGFSPVGVFRDAGYKLGAWRDVGWWQLRFATGAEPPRERLD